MRLDLEACADELQKLGAISHDEAERSLDKLRSLEESKPTLGQAARYGVIGGVAGPTVRAVTDTIMHGKPFHNGLRGVAADAAGSALMAGAVPMIRSHFDRQSEKHTIKSYLKEHESKTAGKKEASPSAERIVKAVRSTNDLTRLSDVADKMRDTVQRLGRNYAKHEHTLEAADTLGMAAAIKGRKAHLSSDLPTVDAALDHLQKMRSKTAGGAHLPKDGLQSGWLANDITQVMSPEDAEHIKQTVPWYNRTGPGLIPTGVVGA